MPPLIAKALPRLSARRYEQLKASEAFLMRDIATCPGCFLHLTRVGAPHLHARLDPPIYGGAERRDQLPNGGALYVSDASLVARFGGGGSGSGSGVGGSGPVRPGSAGRATATATTTTRLARPGSAPVLRSAGGPPSRPGNATPPASRTGPLGLARPASAAVGAVMGRISEHRGGNGGRGTRSVLHDLAAHGIVPFNNPGDKDLYY